jgi:Holliday junction resolvase RusA-like endonuclease
MAFISTKDALALGLIRPTTTGSKTPAAGVVRRGAAVPQAKRVMSKSGRVAVATREPAAVTFHVPIEPQTKHRARTFFPVVEVFRCWHASKGNFARFKEMVDALSHRSFSTKETETFERNVASFASAAMRGRIPFDVPVHVDIQFRLAGTEDLLPVDRSDPDLDNMEKALLDALNGVVWTDDRLVCSKSAFKACAPEAGIVVSVRALSGASSRP